MASLIERSLASTELTEALTRARRRWRLRHLAMGGAVTLGALLVALAIAALVLEQLRFTPTSISGARIAVGLITLAVAARFLVYPLLRHVRDSQLALYLEERVPALGGAVLSAVEVDAAPVPEEARSPLLLKGLFADAARRLSAAPEVPRMELPLTQRALAMMALVLVTGATLIAFGPGYLRDAAKFVLVPWTSPAASPVYSIDVEPGNAALPRGADLQVTAALHGFTSELVELVVRRGERGSWERIPMGAGGDSTRFVVRLFDVAQAAEYFVESNGVRSAVYRIGVRDLPAVSRMDLELHYPAYTGLPDERMEDTGDIAALAGTRVTIQVHATRKVRGGRLVVDRDSVIALVPIDDSTLAARVVVKHDGFYRVELDAQDGTRVAGTLDYSIDALEDRPPQVVIRKPGRDIRPSSVEEVFIEADATDDYGVGKMELVYSVNGGDQKVLPLSDGTGRRPRELTAGHTLFLEEMGLQPGDIVSYYARVWDNDAVSGAKKAASDIYFLTVRPFDREYRQNQQAGGGGGGAQEMEPGALIARQREIISATFKADRDRATTPPTEFHQNVTTIQLAQGKLREQVQELIERVKRPAVQASDSNFRLLAEILPKATTEMKGAEEQLVVRKVPEALPPEQRALQWLERAEAIFKEVQVSMQSGGGGGGAASAANAEDLADLFELQTDKLRNQYEEVQRGAQQQESAKVDEALERLKRLAARQQQENERMRQRAQSNASGGGGAGGSQRQLADDAEALGRQLERLAREQKSQELQQTARDLQEAATQMRRSAANGRSAASGTGSSALDRLEQARKRLEDARENRLTSGLEEAAKQAAQLAAQQREVAKEATQLADSGAGAPNAADRQRRLGDRKGQMANDVDRLEQDLGRMSREAERERAETARKLQGAADAIRNGRLKDKINYSRGAVGRASPDFVRNMEAQIGTDLDSLRDRLSRIAATASLDSAQQRQARALAEARNLVRSLSSIDERMRERTNGTQRGAGADREGKSTDSGARNGRSQSPGQAGQSGQPSGQQNGQQGGQTSEKGGQGSQGGQQGGQQQGSQPGGQGLGGGAQPGQRGLQGGANEAQANAGGQAGGSGQGKPMGGLTAEEMRQFSRELRVQREGAEALRRDLAREGLGTADIDRLIAGLRQLESGKAFNDPDALAKLRNSVVEGFREFEFGLRRQLGESERQGPVLGGTDDVPPGYRELVSEYFRSLSRKKL